MYVSETPEQRAHHHSSRLLRLVQPDFRRYQELDARGDDAPLTALERLELAAKCATLAVALERAAATWDTTDPALAAAYRRLARGWHDESARHEAVAGLAPSSSGDDPFAGR